MCINKITHLGALGTDHNVAHHCQLAATTQAVARNGRNDGRPPEFRDGLPFGKHVRVVGLLEGLVLHLRNIGAGSKSLGARSRQHHASDAFVFVKNGCGVDQILKKGIVEGVQRLGPVQLHDGNFPPSLLGSFDYDVLVRFLQT